MYNAWPDTNRKTKFVDEQIPVPAHVTAHPQRGYLFENWAMTELLKAQTNRGIKPTLHFLRDKEGHEIDALIATGPDTFQAVEIKSGETVAADFFSGLDYWRSKLTKQSLTAWLIHGGTAHQDREKATVLPWNNLSPPLVITRSAHGSVDFGARWLACVGSVRADTAES